MAGEARVEEREEVTPEACRRFFFERGDVSLGIMPQLLLAEREADLWSLFWYAARQVDDAIEAGVVRGETLVGALARGQSKVPYERAVQVFLLESKDLFEQAPLMEGMTRALRALDAERGFHAPPPLGDYLRVVVEKAGFPLLVLNTLMLQGEPGSAIQRFSFLLAASIQLGDDCRDFRRDRDRGADLLTREEIETVRARGLDPESAEGLKIIQANRESVCKWLALRALDLADRFVLKATRDLARTEVFLWLYQIESGQLRETSRPVRWPGPLADLLQGKPLTVPRLAAGRILVRNNPNLFGDPRRWEEKNRASVIRLLSSEVPEYYRHALAPE